MAEMGLPAFGSEHPRAESPGRIVADVVRVAALKVGDPVTVLVLVKADDFSQGHSKTKRR